MNPLDRQPTSLSRTFIRVLITAVLLGPTLRITSQRASATTAVAPLTENQLCTASPRLGTTVVQWNDVLLEIIRDAKPGPPVVARTLSMLHTAMYDAWAAYDDTAVGTRYLDRLRRPPVERTEANKRTAMSYAAYDVIGDLYPSATYLCLRQGLMLAQGLDPAAGAAGLESPIGVGRAAAAAVIQFRHNDGANQLAAKPYSDYTGYAPVNTPYKINDPNRWQPLATSNGNLQGACNPGTNLITQTHVAPHWGLVTPFALDIGPVISPTRGPALYPSPEYTLQAREIVSISASLTDRQKVIAEYWADGPASELPPGHWTLIAAFVSQRDGHTLDQDVRMFFAMTNATLDAGILAWKLKRQYDYVRPITAIRFLFKGQDIRAWGGPLMGTQTIRGEDWQPFQQLCFVTPAFSEFVSGHSTFSASAAEVLKRFTGSDVYSASITLPAGWSPIEPTVTPAQPVTLTWPTFTDAANEAGLSRRYGGIHFADGDLIGRALGRQVGERAWERTQLYFSGTLTFSHDIYLPAVIGPANVTSNTLLVSTP